MPTPYNLTGMNATNFMDKIGVLNNASDGSLAIGILILIGAVMFFAMKDWSIKQASASSLFITTVIAMVMFAGGLLDILYLSVLIVLTSIAGIVLFWSK